MTVSRTETKAAKRKADQLEDNPVEQTMEKTLELERSPESEISADAILSLRCGTSANVQLSEGTDETPSKCSGDEDQKENDHVNTVPDTNSTVKHWEGKSKPCAVFLPTPIGMSTPLTWPPPHTGMMMMPGPYHAPWSMIPSPTPSSSFPPYPAYPPYSPPQTFSPDAIAFSPTVDASKTDQAQTLSSLHTKATVISEQSSFDNGLRRNQIHDTTPRAPFPPKSLTQMRASP
jgi:hypothetical protein